LWIKCAGLTDRLFIKDRKKHATDFSIGLSLVLTHLVGIPITGTSVNPARSLEPALIVGGTSLNQLWLLWFALIMGGLFAAGIWRLIKWINKARDIDEDVQVPSRFSVNLAMAPPESAVACIAWPNGRIRFFGARVTEKPKNMKTNILL
jgi:Major intrinsic protein